MFYRIIFTFYFLLFTSAISAQQFGGNPPSLKWKQINSDTARIIFPAGLDSQAQQVASIVRALSNATLITAGGHQNKINIVFQNQTTISNAYVGLAPFRSEFQLTPEQNSFDLGSLPWQQQLAIHEYRHVQQYNNYRVGLSKAFYYLFGEGGQALANSLAVPNWFFEGDAVYQETLVSKQGRGRLPYFFNGYKSMWAADKNYSYLKLRNGSLRDYVPDHYPIGYMLVAYGREKYGEGFWKKVTLDAASFKGLFYPLQKGIEKYAGISFIQFRNDALNYFKNQMSETAKKDSASMFANKQKHFVADEEFPQFINDNEIVFVKTTYKKIPAFVTKNLMNGNEKVIKTKSISLDNYFSYRNNKIVYAAYEPDLRWNWRDYSVIRILDLRTKKDKKITSKSKYFSPDISEDGKHIVAVNVSTDGKSELHILNSINGSVEKIISNNDHLFYTYPKFYNDKEIVTAVRNTKGEMTLGIFTINDGSVKYITPFSFNVIGFPSVQHDTIYFSASHNGLDQFFAATENHLYKIDLPISNTVTGNYQINIGAQKLLWASFTAVGYTMYSAEKNKIILHEISPDVLREPLILQNINSLNSGTADLLDKISDQNFTENKYSSSYKLLNFHSWRPYINDPDYSFSLASENVLNTLQSELFVGYNRNEKYKQVGFDATYAQLFPWIDAGINYTFDRNAFYKTQKVFWNEAKANIGFSVPLNFTKARTYTSLQFGGDLIYDQRYFKGIYKDTFSTKGFAYINTYVNFSNQIQQANQQIYPRFAQTISLSYNRAVTTINGNQFLASGSFYLPGLFYTHNIILSAAFQKKDSLHEVSFSNNFPFSRGYSGENFYKMYLLAANYHFPLVYPDWGFGSIIYFLRIRANVYFDYTKALDFFNNGSKFQPQYRSYGTEIFFDTKWWNQLPVSFGIRYSRLLDADYEGRGPSQWEFILPINLLSK
jgi:hypothetical protein